MFGGMKSEKNDFQKNSIFTGTPPKPEKNNKGAEPPQKTQKTQKTQKMQHPQNLQQKTHNTHKTKEPTHPQIHINIVPQEQQHVPQQQYSQNISLQEQNFINKRRQGGNDRILFTPLTPITKHNIHELPTQYIISDYQRMKNKWNMNNNMSLMTQSLVIS